MGGAVVRMAGAVLATTLAASLAVSGCADRGAVAPGAAHATASGAATPRQTSRGPVQGTHSSRSSGLEVGRSAWVAVAVSTLWRSPDSPRAVDAPALRRPVAIETWLRDMTLSQRRALNGRADTQALLGDRVVILALPSSRPTWARVAVPSQPSPLNLRGYPGWVPRRQLTARTPTSSARRATVVTRTAWLRTDRRAAARVFRVSFGTALPLVGGNPRFVRVATPSGAVRRLASSAVRVHRVGRPALAPSRRSLVRTAKQFVGLPYLWAGASGFGLDCSGLTWITYRAHGIRIPRDAEPQSRHGTHVATPRRGDLMFYAASGVVHHVSMYVGGGRMVHSPRTGQRVQVIATSTAPYAAEYAGSRRYLP